MSLTGICKKALENNLCLGCNKLETPLFIGQAKCEYVYNPTNKIKTILGVQEKLDL